MTRFFFLLIGLGLFNAASAQLSTSKDTAYLNLEPQQQVKALINVLNPNEIQYHWTLIQDDIKPHYSFIEMCDCKDCFGNKAYPMVDSCFANSGQVKTFSIEVLAGDTIRDGLFVIEVENSSDPTDKARLVYRIRTTPSSLNNRTSAQHKVSIQPNPSNGMLSVVTENFESAMVFDITGILVFESTNSDMDLSQFPKGLYLMEVTAGQHRSSHKITLR